MSKLVTYLCEGVITQSNSELDSDKRVNGSSIKSLARNNLQGLSHSELIQGNQAFGTILENSGLHSFPSQQTPQPYGVHYFRGGYNLARYSSRDGGTLDGIQIELHFEDRVNRGDSVEASAEKITDSLIQHINLHYNDSFTTNYCGLLNEDSILDYLPAILAPINRD